MANFITKGPKYATVELNKVASRKTGEIEAQCELASTIESLENGAIMFIDAAKDEIVKTYSATCVDAMYLHFSNPRRYEDGRSGMENFIYERNDDYETMGVKYLPRMYKLTAGDLFTTDYDYATGKAYVKDATLAEEGKAITFGNHSIVAVKHTTMPNGKPGVLYRVVK